MQCCHATTVCCSQHAPTCYTGDNMLGHPNVGAPQRCGRCNVAMPQRCAAANMHPHVVGWQHAPCCATLTLWAVQRCHTTTLCCSQHAPARCTGGNMPHVGASQRWGTHNNGRPQRWGVYNDVVPHVVIWQHGTTLWPTPAMHRWHLQEQEMEEGGG